MAFRIHIAPGSTTPIYRQIVEQIRAGVAHEELLEGAGLPSVRALAAELVVNPNTVAKAYTQLCHEGVLESRRGRGMFVAERRQVLSRAERKRRLKKAAEHFASEAMLLGYEREQASELFNRLWIEKRGDEQ